MLLLPPPPPKSPKLLQKSSFEDLPDLFFLGFFGKTQGAAKGVRQKEFDHFFRFRDAFGHFSVTFSDASVTFFVTFLPNSFCRTPFAAG